MKKALKMLVAKYEPRNNDLSEESFSFQSTDELILSDKICILAISQLCRILTQNHRIQELDKLKRLYELTSAPFFLDDSKSILSTFSTFQDTEAEIDNNSDDDKNYLDEYEESYNILRLDCDINKLLTDQEHLVKDRQTKWLLNDLFSANLEAFFFVANI
ncbi:14853_t:CDS:2 [Cetraspora pellucida]|uniref:14853_t:CDS:1 n=1 Tax=Cetraspora pellucida TaxID=1433469 RepID=A0A9N9A743_9GLOM|nr:14853_t:CDS:2 [Cetraspora pellucida]